MKTDTKLLSTNKISKQEEKCKLDRKIITQSKNN